MTHDPSHAFYLASAAIYFIIATYFSIRNYLLTKHEGFWFFMSLFSITMAGSMISGTLWSAGIISEDMIHPFYDILFLISAAFLFVGTYTLHKKHHEVKIF
jgi:hypothetical protein